MPYDTSYNRLIAQKLLNIDNKFVEHEKKVWTGNDPSAYTGGAISHSMNRRDEMHYGGSSMLGGESVEGNLPTPKQIPPIGAGFSAGAYSAGGFSAGVKKISSRGFSAGAKRGRPKKVVSKIVEVVLQKKKRGRPSKKMHGGVSLEELQKGKEALKKKVNVPKEEIKKEGVEGVIEELKKGVKLRPKKDVAKVEKVKEGREKLLEDIKASPLLKKAPKKDIKIGVPVETTIEEVKKEIIEDTKPKGRKRQFKIRPVLESYPQKAVAMGKPKSKAKQPKMKGGILPILGAVASALPLEEIGSELYRTSGLYEETPEELEQHKMQSELHGLERQAYKDLQWANIQNKYKGKESNKEYQRLKKVYGKGKAKPKRQVSQATKKRAEIVKKVMNEKGLSLIEASKYVKQHNLY